MKIGIISLGLIGGSLFKKLIETNNEIYAVTRNQETINKALKLTNNVSSEINILKECDMVFVASPIGKTIEILDSLENIVDKNCIVLDCASVKGFIMEKKRPYKFIGSHPMAGTENSGFESSFKELFSAAKWVLTPSEDIKKEDLDKAVNIIQLTGAAPILTNAKEHDEAVALISHLPLLISQSLFNTAKDNPLALKLASSGFRDMTRLAMSNIQMAMDMYNYNQKNIDNSLISLNQSINYLKENKNTELFDEIKKIRSNMYSKEGKNIL